MRLYHSDHLDLGEKQSDVILHSIFPRLHASSPHNSIIPMVVPPFRSISLLESASNHVDRVLYDAGTRVAVEKTMGMDGWMGLSLESAQAV